MAHCQECDFKKCKPSTDIKTIIFHLASFGILVVDLLCVNVNMYVPLTLYFS